MNTGKLPKRRYFLRATANRTRSGNYHVRTGGRLHSNAC